VPVEAGAFGGHMKRIILVGLLSLLVGCSNGGESISNQEQRVVPQQEASEVVEERVEFEEPEEEVGVPVMMEIDKLGIVSEVEPVGLARDGRMDVPDGYWHVGWCDLGYKPGEEGNAVIAGHLDSPNGAAIFYRLGELRAGDVIEVQDDDGNWLEFEVQDKRVYKDATFPIEEVFGQTGERRLNLITCSGVFNPSSRNYSERLVIYSELIES